MILALYTIISTAALLWLSAKLNAAREEIARMRDQSQDMRDDYSAYAHGVTMTLAYMLAYITVASWHAQRSRKEAGK